MLKIRYLSQLIREDLGKKMVFIGGPRQVGKTTLALGLLEKRGRGASERSAGYLSWDDLQDRANLIQQRLPSDQDLIIIDEIHKYKNWRSLVKGLYDKNKSHVRFLVTGSAKLDYFLKGGDTLLGRYHYYRLHPFTLNELASSPSMSDLESLMRFGGFPEPLLAGNEKELRRWQLQRSQRVIFDDLRSLENVKEISTIETLVSILPERVGSPLSIEKLRILLSSSHQTIERYIQILERLYFVYRVPPFGGAKVKAVKKEQKLFLWDWSTIQDEGSKFENLVASHLLKYCHFLQDAEGHDMDLRFIRNVEGKEIDFVVLKDKKPIFAVECKSGERNLSPAITYFKNRLGIPKVYQVHRGTKNYGNASTTGQVIPFIVFCKLEKLY